MDSPIQTFVNGISGRMGQEILGLFQGGGAPGLEFCGGWSGSTPISLPLDMGPRKVLILDFSTTVANQKLCKFIAEWSPPAPVELSVLVGTTGLDEAALENWSNLYPTKLSRLLVAPNTSIGVFHLMKLSSVLASALSGLGFDIEIVETHHREKADAPSGTARMLGDCILKAAPGLTLRDPSASGKRPRSSLGISAVRGGGVLGEHEVRFIGDDEELMISHRAFSRRLFARGALELGKWLVRQPLGSYHIGDIEKLP